jgi:hypothetical protein
MLLQTSIASLLAAQPMVRSSCSGSSYSALYQHMTTTFSLTQMAAAKLKAAAAVILVSWRSIALPTFSLPGLLASCIGFIGDAATAEQILEANLPDDNTCLCPRQKCSGCAAQGYVLMGLLTTLPAIIQLAQQLSKS